MSSAILRGVGYRIPQGKMGRNKFSGQSPTVLMPLSVERKKFSNISNTGLPLYLSRGRYYDNWQSTDSGNKENVEYLHEDASEIDCLRKLLAKRDATIESQSLEIVKCKETIESQSREKQKVWDDWKKVSEQNQKLVQTLGKLFGEFCNMRENLRLLEHQYNLMASLHKANKTEHRQPGQCQGKHQIGSKGKMAKSPQQSQQFQGVCQSGRTERIANLAQQGQGMPQTGSKAKMAQLPRQSDQCQCIPQTGSKAKMAQLPQQSEQCRGIPQRGSKEKMAQLPRQSEQYQGRPQTGSKAKMAQLPQQAEQCQSIPQTGSKAKWAQLPQQSEQFQGISQTGSKEKMAQLPRQSEQCQGRPQTGSKVKMAQLPRQSEQCQGIPQAGSKGTMVQLPQQSEQCQGMPQTGSQKEMAELSQQSHQLQGMHPTGSKEPGESQDIRQVLMEDPGFSQRRKNISNEAGNSPRTTEPANVQNKNSKRSGLRRRSENVCYKEPDLEPEPRWAKHTVSAQRLGQRGRAPSSTGRKETLEKIPEDQEHHVAAPPSELLDDSCHISLLQTASEKGTQQFRRPATGRPMRRAATIVASYKEWPLNAKMRRSH